MFQFIQQMNAMLGKRLLLSFSVAVVLMASVSASAATVELEWVEPDSFRDIHPGGNSREKFREDTFAELEANFAKLATERLPTAQILQITVRDLDLAGYVNVDSKTRRKRFVSSKYFPRIKFNYKLLAENGAVIKAGGVILKKPDFMETTSDENKALTLGYEKQMIDEWFKYTFGPREEDES
ncbi:DUF3016 domain-containing protein [Thalassotalea euphylliae]|uniref:DUF3016 domain-containing protein n=1 Tax=Thalassotalea euphylliae TaxID=1655234 RepID=UPI00363BABFC